MNPPSDNSKSNKPLISPYPQRFQPPPPPPLRSPQRTPQLPNPTLSKPPHPSLTSSSHSTQRTYFPPKGSTDIRTNSLPPQSTENNGHLKHSINLHHSVNKTSPNVTNRDDSEEDLLAPAPKPNPPPNRPFDRLTANTRFSSFVKPLNKPNKTNQITHSGQNNLGDDDDSQVVQSPMGQKESTYPSPNIPNGFHQSDLTVPSLDPSTQFMLPSLDPSTQSLLPSQSLPHFPTQDSLSSLRSYNPLRSSPKLTPTQTSLLKSNSPPSASQTSTTTGQNANPPTAPPLKIKRDPNAYDSDSDFGLGLSSDDEEHDGDEKNKLPPRLGFNDFVRLQEARVKNAAAAFLAGTWDGEGDFYDEEWEKHFGSTKEPNGEQNAENAENIENGPNYGPDEANQSADFVQADDSLILDEQSLPYCPICQDDPIDPSIPTCCSHIYCKLCIHDWVDKESSCPLCKCRVHAVHTFDYSILVEYLTGKHTYDVGCRDDNGAIWTEERICEVVDYRPGIADLASREPTPSPIEVRLVQFKSQPILNDDMQVDPYATAVENTICFVCGKEDWGHDDDEILLCDGHDGLCTRGCHFLCHDPPLSSTPDLDWFCNEHSALYGIKKRETNDDPWIEALLTSLEPFSGILKWMHWMDHDQYLALVETIPNIKTKFEKLDEYKAAKLAYDDIIKGIVIKPVKKVRHYDDDDDDDDEGDYSDIHTENSDELTSDDDDDDDDDDTDRYSRRSSRNSAKHSSRPSKHNSSKGSTKSKRFTKPQSLTAHNKSTKRIIEDSDTTPGQTPVKSFASNSWLKNQEERHKNRPNVRRKNDFVLSSTDDGSSTEEWSGDGGKKRGGTGARKGTRGKNDKNDKNKKGATKTKSRRYKNKKFYGSSDDGSSNDGQTSEDTSDYDFHQETEYFNDAFTNNLFNQTLGNKKTATQRNHLTNHHNSSNHSHRHAQQTSWIPQRSSLVSSMQENFKDNLQAIIPQKHSIYQRKRPYVGNSQTNEMVQLGTHNGSNIGINLDNSIKQLNQLDNNGGNGRPYFQTPQKNNPNNPNNPDTNNKLQNNSYPTHQTPKKSQGQIQNIQLLAEVSKNRAQDINANQRNVANLYRRQQAQRLVTDFTSPDHSTQLANLRTIPTNPLLRQNQPNPPNPPNPPNNSQSRYFNQINQQNGQQDNLWNGVSNGRESGMNPPKTDSRHLSNDAIDLGSPTPPSVLPVQAKQASVGSLYRRRPQDINIQSVKNGFGVDVQPMNQQPSRGQQVQNNSLYSRQNHNNQPINMPNRGSGYSTPNINGFANRTNSVSISQYPQYPQPKQSFPHQHPQQQLISSQQRQQLQEQLIQQQQQQQTQQLLQHQIQNLKPSSKPNHQQQYHVISNPNPSGTVNSSVNTIDGANKAKPKTQSLFASSSGNGRVGHEFSFDSVNYQARNKPDGSMDIGSME